MPRIVCLTPIKNEMANLPRFLATTSLWADNIILADQGSTDGSREYALSWPKVRLIDNPSTTYSESVRQKLLVDAARELSGPRVLIALDADEIMTANILSDRQWQEAILSPPGTMLQFRWINLRPGCREYWCPKPLFAWGLVDDGTIHQGTPIHSVRIPVSPQAPGLNMQQVHVLHYQYVDWSRMKQKHRWYQCWEWLNTPDLGPIRLYRRYHHMDAVSPREIKPVRPEWFDGYQTAGIDLTPILSDPNDSWWDREILQWLIQHGPSRFRRVNIWDVDWNERYRTLLGKEPPISLADPRTGFDRWLLSWLGRSQLARRRPDHAIINKIFRLWLG